MPGPISVLNRRLSSVHWTAPGLNHAKMLLVLGHLLNLPRKGSSIPPISGQVAFGDYPKEQSSDLLGLLYYHLNHLHSLPVNHWPTLGRNGPALAQGLPRPMLTTLEIGR